MVNTELRSEHSIEFHGRTREFFRIWIVNVLLSIITLGIYSAWAKVRTQRYFYGSTLIEGSAFEYTADPVKILKGRLLAVALLAIYQLVSMFYAQIAGFTLLALVLLAPALVVMSIRFRMRYSRWRGISFNFNSDYKGAYLLFFPVVLYFAFLAVAPFIIGIDLNTLPQGEEDEIPVEFLHYSALIGAGFLVAMLAFPWWQHRYYRYIGNRTGYGSHRFRYIGNAAEFYSLYFLAGIIFFGGLIVAGIGAGLGSKVLPESFAAVAIVPLILLPYALAAAQVQTARTNVVYNNLEVGDLFFKSDLRLGRMASLYITNTLAIIATLGLAVPWARIRMARYRAETLTLVTSSFDEFVAASTAGEQAYGEGVSDVFGWDLGL